jgi:hypothetical protein
MDDSARDFFFGGGGVLNVNKPLHKLDIHIQVCSIRLSVPRRAVEGDGV